MLRPGWSLAVLLSVLFLFSSAGLYAQPWSGILQPTYGSGACTLVAGSSPAGCGIDWTANSALGSSGVGVPGGIPNRTSICATVQASTYGNGSTDATSGIQSALNNCGAAHAGDVNGNPGGVVLLSAGNFLIAGQLIVPSNVTLRGAGTTAASGTVLNSKRTAAEAVIQMGSGVGNAPTTVTDVTSGTSAGSTSVTVANSSGISVGTLLEFSEPNNPAYVSIEGSQGSNCSWCDSSRWNGSRVRGQTVMTTGVSGTTVSFTPPLYSTFSAATKAYNSSTAYAEGQVVVSSGACYVFTNGTASSGHAPPNGSYWAAMASCNPQVAYHNPTTVWAGVESLQVYANGTADSGGVPQSSAITSEGIYNCAYCWVKGIENNYSDGDHVQVEESYRDEIRDSYFAGTWFHQAGQTDATVNVREKSSGVLVENNIFERLHLSVMEEWGSSGNVFAYNFSTGNFDTSVCTGTISANSYCVTMMDYDLNHGAHPQFSLVEGNVGARVEADEIWGSTSHDAYFRNWMSGTTFDCNPLKDGRQNYSCNSGAWTNEAIRAYEASQVYGASVGGTGTWYESVIGNVLGSAAQQSLGTPYTSGGSPCTACQVSPTTRLYSDQPTDLTFGYLSSGDNTGACSSRSSCMAFTTNFLHGNYDYAASAVEVWQPGVTHTLPPSFTHSSQPSWWGSSIPWPAIGPDVTSGDTASGHAYLTASNPAQACWNDTATLSDGSRAFDPTACYQSSGSGGAPPPPPANLTVVVQ